jgi:hypothetical protein
VDETDLGAANICYSVFVGSLFFISAVDFYYVINKLIILVYDVH